MEEIRILGKVFDAWEIESLDGAENAIIVKLRNGEKEVFPCKTEEITKVIDDVFEQMDKMFNRL